jgi:hypothetical protein
MAGMLAAAAVFVATYPRLKKVLDAGSLGRVTVAEGTPARIARQPLDVVARPRGTAPQQVTPGVPASDEPWCCDPQAATPATTHAARWP